MTHGPGGDASSGLDYEESEHSGRVVRIASVAALGGLTCVTTGGVVSAAIPVVKHSEKPVNVFPDKSVMLVVLKEESR